MKVLYLPLNFGDVVQSGVYDAFRLNGCELEVFDYMNMHVGNKNTQAIRSNLISRVNSFKPNLLFMQIQHTTIIDAETIGVIKRDNPRTIIVNWTGDVRAFVPPTYKAIAQLSDFNFISSTGQMEMFAAELGKPVNYLQIGYNPALYYPDPTQKQDFRFDTVFIGHHNAKERYPDANKRIQASKLCQQSFGDRFALYGHGWPKELKSRGSIDQSKVSTDVYHKSVSVISISHFNDIAHYFSDRLLMCLASGRPTISLKFPRWESYFTHMCDLIMIDDVSEIPGIVNMLKENPELANYIGASGAAKVLAEHTYESMIQELLTVVGLV